MSQAKQTQSIAALALIKAAQSAQSAFAAIVASLGKAYGVDVPKTADKKADRVVLKAWSVETLKGAGIAAKSLDNYLSTAASIAVMPNAIGTVTQGKGEKASISEVTLGEAKTATEFRAIAEAANKKLGISKPKVPKADKPVTPAEPVNPKYDAAVTAEAEHGHVQSFVAAIKLALDGKKAHRAMFEALESTLKAEGWELKIAAVNKTDKAKLAKVTKAQVARLAKIVEADQQATA